MNKLKLYFRLVVQSQQKNRQFYLPFLLTAAGCAAMFYIMRFLCYSGIDSKVRGGVYLLIILGLGCIVIGYTAMCILWYANKFVMRRRQKELGLYHILGMQKSDVACVLGMETVLLAFAGILLGLAVGILFSKLTLLLFLKLVHFEAPFGFTVCLPGIWQTAILMAVIFAVLLCYNFACIARSKPVELLHSENVGEREPKSRWLIAVTGVVTLAGGYAIALLVKDPVTALMLFFVAVTLVIIGTYCLFTACSIVILKALRKNKPFYYQPQNFTSVSGMLYRMKQNAKGLANICILATMVLVTVSCTVCMYSGSENALKTLYPDEISLHYICPSETMEQEDFTGLVDTVRQRAVQLGCAEEETTSYLRIAFSASDEGGNYSLTSRNYSEMGKYAVLTCLDAEDFERLSGREISLAEDEVLAYNLPEGQDTIQVGGMTFHVKEPLETFPVVCDTFSSQLADNRYLVVSDRSILQKLYQAQLSAYGEKRASSLVYTISVNPVEKDIDLEQCAAELNTASDGYLAQAGSNLRFSSMACRASARGEFYVTYGGFLFLGLFLGLLFALATVLIMYYKQTSEGYEDRQRFVILQKVGMSENEVRTTIRRQVLMIFFLPLLVAAVHVLFAFPMIVRLFTLFSLSNVPLFALCTAATFFVFAVAYVLVYLATARRYYQIVRA